MGRKNKKMIFWRVFKATPGFFSRLRLPNRISAPIIFCLTENQGDLRLAPGKTKTAGFLTALSILSATAERRRSMWFLPEQKRGLILGLELRRFLCLKTRRDSISAAST